LSVPAREQVAELATAERSDAATKVRHEIRPTSRSLIGQTIVMKGELVVGEDLEIEGTFNGSITGYGNESVTVRRVARVIGEVTASEVRIENGTNLRKAVLSGRIRLADDH
jgi:cytoskeletal protein CcmA (bactofilin family)